MCGQLNIFRNTLAGPNLTDISHNETLFYFKENM